MKDKYSNKCFPKLINELTCDHCNNNYCFIKVFLELLHPEPIVLVQLKCIEFFKWEQSEKVGYDIGWEEAGLRWAMDGYASAFRDVFNDSLSVKDNYRLTMEKYKTYK